METALTTILGAATLALLGRIVFDWLRGKKNSGVRCTHCPEFKNLCADISWIKEVHDRQDADGVPVWYVPRSWHDELTSLNEKAGETNTLLLQILEQLRVRPASGG